MSNPWFDIEYRRLQSQLFIKALEVRKEFLYANVKNIKAAYIIWSKQKDYLEHKNIIAEAWHWINMTIPIIGSTFASFSRMCTNMGKETLGHLFIDEAGQALPLSDGTLWEGQIALYFRWTCLPDGAVPELAAGSRRDDR